MMSRAPSCRSDVGRRIALHQPLAHRPGEHAAQQPDRLACRAFAAADAGKRAVAHLLADGGLAVADGVEGPLDLFLRQRVDRAAAEQRFQVTLDAAPVGGSGARRLALEMPRTSR